MASAAGLPASDSETAGLIRKDGSPIVHREG